MAFTLPVLASQILLQNQRYEGHITGVSDNCSLAWLILVARRFVVLGVLVDIVWQTVMNRNKICYVVGNTGLVAQVTCVIELLEHLYREFEPHWGRSRKMSEGVVAVKCSDCSWSSRGLTYDGLLVTERALGRRNEKAVGQDGLCHSRCASDITVHRIL